MSDALDVALLPRYSKSSIKSLFNSEETGATPQFIQKRIQELVTQFIPSGFETSSFAFADVAKSVQLEIEAQISADYKKWNTLLLQIHHNTSLAECWCDLAEIVGA